ncbi:Transcriptional regulator of ribosomal biogenesis proteins, partial [Coemansia sp. RSA 2049]
MAIDEDFYYPRDLEESFCRDFSCCGLILNDLHDLLQHYEECHVRFEDDEAQQDLGDDCFFDEGWVPVSDCLTPSTAVHSTAATADLASFGLSLEQQLILGTATATATASSTAVPSPELSAKDTSVGSPADTLLRKAESAETNLTTKPKVSITPPLSPSDTASSSVINSPHESAIPFPIDTAMANRKRTAGVSVAASPVSSGNQSPIKRRATFSNPKSNDGSEALTGSADLAFTSSVLGLYDDDIIAAIASATDPLFLSGAAAAASSASSNGANGQKSGGDSSAAAAAATFAAATKNSDIIATSASLAEAATAAVNAVTSFDDSEDFIHLPPSVTAAMAGAVAAAAAAKAHGLLPRDDKPYRCPVSSCDKAYKNPNGLKYHNLHGHCTMGEEALGISKPYKCRVPECYKAYKNLNGLKYHVQHAHCAMIPSIRDLPPNASPAEVAAA